MKKILLAGESWMSYTTHVKGFDAFYTSAYEEGADAIRAALARAGYDLTFLPNHLASTQFPYTPEELSCYDCIILSDIGSNTLLLPPETFSKSETRPNRCQLIKDYVLAGGALLMIGGYLSFSGVDAKARYGATPVQDVLPVDCLLEDDRAEHPEGITPVTVARHRALDGLPEQWPAFLGYNRTRPNAHGEVLATIGGEPFIAVGAFGKGRSAVFASDCSPHWGPPAFLSWQYYDALWAGLLAYLTE